MPGHSREHLQDIVFFVFFISPFEFRYCFGFRYSDFEFPRRSAAQRFSFTRQYPVVTLVSLLNTSEETQRNRLENSGVLPAIFH
jgi:hypothetical protein